ncbi:glycosyltransferase family A protein [Agromyces sp. Marseille-P2726]|uniref:glycosyltransferase family A protein n=1 Tax=Agromyces sp. Marseille-P2726 TaxID=2709132 RepID=UPI001570B49A|nr:glycosyltransferase family A protein [Agromyces sp. Marseille-P2726]
MSLRLSVVVPSYNDAVMLEQCLHALVRQTRLPDEIVVVDNGSTDATVDVARAAGARIVTEPRRGIPLATSAGFDAAVGDILGRLDADTIPPVDWVARVHRAFADDSRLDALSGPGRFYGGNAAIRWYAEHVHMPMYYRFVAWVLGHDVLYGSNLAIRASAWRVLRKHVHRELPDVTDDLDLTINLQPGMRVRFDPSLVVQVSARPFESWARNNAAVGMARHTALVNRREVPFLERRRAWVASRAPGGDRRAR